MIIKRHLVTYPDSITGVTSESWFESYSGAQTILGMLHDAEYIGMRVWPPPLWTVPVTDDDLRRAQKRR